MKCPASTINFGFNKTPMQDGQYVLTEGEALTAESKFYLVENGEVVCLRAFEVRSMRAHNSPLALLRLAVVTLALQIEEAGGFSPPHKG